MSFEFLRNLISATFYLKVTKISRFSQHSLSATFSSFNVTFLIKFLVTDAIKLITVEVSPFFGKLTELTIRVINDWEQRHKLWSSHLGTDWKHLHLLYKYCHLRGSFWLALDHFCQKLKLQCFLFMCHGIHPLSRKRKTPGRKRNSIQMKYWELS